MQHPVGVRPVPHEHPGVRRAHRHQVELERGHHAESAAAAARRPQQITVCVVGGAHERAVGKDKLDGR
jgi:hypothetical protein